MKVSYYLLEQFDIIAEELTDLDYKGINIDYHLYEKLEYLFYPCGCIISELNGALDTCAGAAAKFLLEAEGGDFKLEGLLKDILSGRVSFLDLDIPADELLEGIRENIESNFEQTQRAQALISLEILLLCYDHGDLERLPEIEAV